MPASHSGEGSAGAAFLVIRVRMLLALPAFVLPRFALSDGP
jgi:hypothetical protein